MNLEISYIEDRCKPEGNASGLFLKAYDIHGEETKRGTVVKTKYVLGKTESVIKDLVSGVSSVISVDKKYKLDTLYRCIIDTGVEIPDTSQVNLEVQPLATTMFTKGIIVSPTVYVITKGEKKYIGVVVINLSTFYFPIVQFDVIARLKITLKPVINICHK